MILRHLKEIIEDAIKHYPITLLTGPRQTGKSTLLYTEFASQGFNYVSLDDPLELSMAISDPRTFLSLHQAPLIIDEAQKAKELFVELERIVNESRLKHGNKKSNGMYILSGSQRSKLLDESQESLSGRVALIDMNNLSMSEIFKRKNCPFSVNASILASRLNDYRISQSEVFEYIVRGFFPVLYDDLDMKPHLFYSSYVATYLEKDLKEFINVSDSVKFINFLRVLASNTGEELVYDSYAKNIGISLNTVKAWISILVKTSIIYLVNSYNDDSIVKRVVKRPKMYFFDTGLASYLCGIDSAKTLENSFLKGRFFETFVLNEVRKSYLNNGDNQPLYYYRDSDQNEIDFVLLRNAALSCIEIKSGQSFNVKNTKAFKKLSNTKYNKGTNAIICTSEKLSIISDGTLIVPFTSI